MKKIIFYRFFKQEIKELIGKHNARILNNFQSQGTPEMPIIAYDERVCLIPAIDISTKQTFNNLTLHHR